MSWWIHHSMEIRMWHNETTHEWKKENERSKKQQPSMIIYIKQANDDADLNNGMSEIKNFFTASLKWSAHKNLLDPDTFIAINFL